MIDCARDITCFDSDGVFELYKVYASQGCVLLMSGLEKTAHDYNDLISIACCFAQKGHTVKVLAKTHYKDPIYQSVFGRLIGTPYYRKCPDLMIDGEYYEYESYDRPFSANKISHMIKRGAEQSNRIIIDNNKGASDRFIISMILKRMNDRSFRKEILELYVYEKGAIRLIYRNKKAVGSLGSPRSTNP